MKIGQIIAIAFGLLIVAAGFVASSSENRESIGASWRRFTDDPGQACFDFERKQLKDPFSARFVSYKEDAESPHGVTVTYYAKNSYSAFSRGEAFCWVSGGKVDVATTEEHRSSLARQKEGKEKLKRMQREIECLDRQVELLRQGKGSAESKRIADC